MEEETATTEDKGLTLLLPSFYPSLISLMVSVDVKHHVYLLTYLLTAQFQSSAAV